MRNTKAGWLAVALVVGTLFSQGCSVSVNGADVGALGAAGGTPWTGGSPLTQQISGALPTGTTGGLLGTPLSGGSFLPGSGSGSTFVSGGAIDSWNGGRMNPSEFFRLLAPSVIESSRRTGVPPAVTLAQAALETGYGASTIGPAKNLFGVRGTGPAGSISAIDNGQRANFRKYSSFTESIEDHDRLLSRNRRYAGAMAVRNDPEAFAREIHRAGYATDPGYSNKLIGIIRQYNLAGVAQV